MASGAGRRLLPPGLKNLIVRNDKCLNRFGDYVEKQRTDFQTWSAFLVSTYLHSPKKNVKLTAFWLALVDNNVVYYKSQDGKKALSVRTLSLFASANSMACGRVTIIANAFDSGLDCIIAHRNMR
jgi:hypothetical protein